MAYGVKYELDFSDVKGNKRSVQILKKNYVGDVFAIVGTDNPVIIKYTNDDDFYNPIIGSSCIVNLKTTDTISYDEFINFDEREYKIRVNIGVEDEAADINSPLWELADTNWQETDYNWAASTTFQVYWEGFLVSDTFTEAIQSKPFDISLRAIDNLGTLDSFLIPDGKINTNTDGTIKTAASEQTLLDSAFYYIHKILAFTGLDFDIYIQNNIRKINPSTGSVETENNNLFQDILINEFALQENFSKLSSKKVLENILRITNSRIYQANASWYIVSNSNYYDTSISGALTTTEDSTGENQDNTVFNPDVTTLAIGTPTNTSGILRGLIISDRGLTIIERGFYFGKNPIILSNPKIVSTDTSTTFTSTQTSLDTGDTYYIMAYAKNNATTEGTGGVIEYVPGGITPDPEPDPISPTLTSIQPNGYNVTNTSIPCAAQVDNVGTSNVTKYGFYFGTNSNLYTENTRYEVATGQNLSTAFGFVTDTSGAPFNLTLTAGTPYYITPFAVNNTGEGVGTTITQYTWNAWELRKQSDSSQEFVPYTNDSRTDNVYISTSSSSAECYTIMIGAFRASLAGLPTISGACQDDTTEPVESVEQTCVKIRLYRSNTAKDLCCETPTSRDAYINGTDFYSNTGTTKVFINDDCSTLLTSNQYLSSDLVNYRYWNGTNLQNTIGCQSTSVDTCEEDVVTPSAFVVKNEITNEEDFVVYNAAFSIEERVTISDDVQNECWTIIQEYPASANPTRTITASCTTPKPTPTESCPTMTFFARYLKCNDDRIEIIGNNTENFPNYIKQKSTGDCWSFIDRTGQTQSDDNFNLGCTPTNKFEIDFLSCDDCLGISTTTQVPPPPTTTTQPSIFYRIYQSLQSNCSVDDTIIEVFNQTNDFPTVITNGSICYTSLQDGGAGESGDVDNFLDFADCAACQAYLSTTTTQTPTTTQAPCIAIQANVTTSALNACCGGKAVTIYINSTSLSTTTVVYTNSNCTTILGAGNFIKHSEGLFYWNGNTLSSSTCPGCSDGAIQ